MPPNAIKSFELQERCAPIPISRGTLMLPGMLSVVRRARHRFSDPSGAAEFEMVGILWAFGLWLLQSSWIKAQLPAVARQIEVLLPIPLCGVTLLVLGIITAVASIMEWHSILAAAFTLIVGLWCAVGWIFCLRPEGPPVIGVLSPVLAAFALVHLLQIPSRSYRRARGDQ